MPPDTQDNLTRGPTKPYGEHADTEALRKENAQLRELVVQLSKLVIKKVVDQS